MVETRIPGRGIALPIYGTIYSSLGPHAVLEWGMELLAHHRRYVFRLDVEQRALCKTLRRLAVKRSVENLPPPTASYQ